MDFCLVVEGAAAAGRAAFAGVRAAPAALSLGIVIQRRPSTGDGTATETEERSAAQEMQQIGDYFGAGEKQTRINGRRMFQTMNR